MYHLKQIHRDSHSSGLTETYKASPIWKGADLEEPKNKISAKTGSIQNSQETSPKALYSETHDHYTSDILMNDNKNIKPFGTLHNPTRRTAQVLLFEERWTRLLHQSQQGQHTVFTHQNLSDLQCQTQNKPQWLAACGHVSASSQSLHYILSLKMNSSFITSRPGPKPNTQCAPITANVRGVLKLIKYIKHTQSDRTIW